MRCSDVTHWLNEGMPSAGAVAARTHAAACPACARALAAAASVERALAAAAPLPPGGPDRFVASVLETIRADRVPARTADRAPERAAAGRAVRRVLGSLLAEPAFAIGAIALLTVALVPALPRSGAARSLEVAATVAAQSMEGAIEPFLRSALAYAAAVAALDPYARAALMTCFLALLVWGGLSIAGAVDRSLRRGAGYRA